MKIHPRTPEPQLARSGLLLLSLLFVLSTHGEAPKVALLRVPSGGIQPQAMVDVTGVVHLIYFKGEAKGGDVFYVRQQPGSETFSEPFQVNSKPRTAIAIGTIRGAQVALGRNSRVHVAWNGSQPAQLHRGAPMLYTRLNEAGTAFEPERDLMTHTINLDGGGSVAADNTGNVYVVWHAHEAGAEEGEENRAVFVARSMDDGKTFAREERANPTPSGACGCCGLRAFADQAGHVFVLYRAALRGTERDETLLVSRNRGRVFEVINSYFWKTTTCPMSSASLSESEAAVLAAWETTGQVIFASVDRKTMKASEPHWPAGMRRRKHPSVAGNSKGEVLLAWVEDSGWQKGGALAWQLFDANGQPTNEKGRVDGVPTWSFASAVPRADGGFVIFY